MELEEVRVLDRSKTKQIHKNRMAKGCCAGVWVMAESKCLLYKFEDPRTYI